MRRKYFVTLTHVKYQEIILISNLKNTRHAELVSASAIKDSDL